MTTSDVDRFTLALRKLCVVFQRSVQPNEETIAIWAEALADIQIEFIESAIVEFIRDTDSEPTPGKIRSIAKDHRRDEYNAKPRLPAPKPDAERPYRGNTPGQLRERIAYAEKRLAVRELTADNRQSYLAAVDECRAEMGRIERGE